MFFYKVGNGHCTYIEFPNGKNGLIDVYVNTEEGYDNVVERLKKANITKIDYLFITHPHRDHIQGLSLLKNNFKIGQFICSPIKFTPDPIYEDWQIYEKIRSGNFCDSSHEVTEGWYTNIGDVRIDYLAPKKQLLKNYPKDVNNNSLILSIQCNGHKIIIPGDMEEAGWSYIPDEHIKDSTLLLASHHGNDSGYHPEKTKAKDLAFVVISSGPKTEHDADNKYRQHVRKKVYTTRSGKIITRIDSNNTLHME